MAVAKLLKHGMEAVTKEEPESGTRMLSHITSEKTYSE